MAKYWQKTDNRPKHETVTENALQEKKTRSRCQLWRLSSEATSRLRENQNKETDKRFLAMLQLSKNSREFRWPWSKILDHRHLPTEVFTKRCSPENSCTSKYTQIIRLNSTVQTDYQTNLRKVRHAKQSNYSAIW